MRLRAEHLRPHGWVARPHAPHPRLVRLLDGIPSGARGQRAGGSWCRSGSRRRSATGEAGVAEPPAADAGAGRSPPRCRESRGRADVLWSRGRHGAESELRCGGGSRSVSRATRLPAVRREQAWRCAAARLEGQAANPASANARPELG